MQDFEKLASFYLGRRYDLQQGRLERDLILYDAKDLTTHAVVVGMTGSGKTGLCISLLEEAALDGVPAIVIDPKGDLPNLSLTFPGLRAQDFAPWIDPAEATRHGRSVDEHAAKVAETWKRGLADWGQDGRRISRLRQSAEFRIHTPGSNAGLPIALLKSLDAPEPALVQDSEAFRERVSATISGLCALLQLDADPLQGREHILLSNILDRAWREGRSIDLPQLIKEVQAPPFTHVGVFDLDTFFPARERLGLAMRLNNLLASPSFAQWREGEPLDVARLLHGPDGRPRVSILSIAHLNDAERMFFVTLLFNQVVSWMRTQPGTSSLRAILYMDEVFGYLPPTANPPSKLPLLTLLKQARAHGLGCLLATQNPVDLDYKALSNAGTWFLGRLQTERDKHRVLEGLEGAAVGAHFDRAAMEATLAGLDSRVFLLNNVHESEPVVFHVRWAMSYLRGPVTRSQVETLVANDKRALTREAEAAKPKLPTGEKRATVAAARAPAEPPTVPADVPVVFLPVEGAVDGELVYRPQLVGRAEIHFANARAGIDTWREKALLAPLPEGRSSKVDWDEAAELSATGLRLDRDGVGGAHYRELPRAATQVKKYATWERALKTHLYQAETLTTWKCTAPKATSEPGETEGEFRVRLAGLAREKRDVSLEKLRARHATKVRRLRDRLHKADERIEREESQLGHQKTQRAIAFGATILGAVLGRKVASTRNIGRASTAMRSSSRVAREKDDVRRAEEARDALQAQLDELEQAFADELADQDGPVDPASFELKSRPVRLRKSDTEVELLALCWTPWRVGPGGPEPLYELARD